MINGIPLFREHNPLTKLALKEIKRYNDIVELRDVKKLEQS